MRKVNARGLICPPGNSAFRDGDRIALAYLRVPMPGVVIINSGKLLAALALICGLVWCFIEDEWFGRA